jgi:hypothetical protein
MSERRRYRLSKGKSSLLEGPSLTRRQKEKVQRLTGIAHALDLDVRLQMPQAEDEPAHLRLRDERGDTVHVVVFCGGEASRFAAADAKPLPPSLSAEIRQEPLRR